MLFRSLGFISAVAFATILAVVAGLTLSGASAVSHDLYASVWRHGRVDQAQELRVSKITTVCLGIVAVALGIAFEKENVAYMVMLAFVVVGLFSYKRLEVEQFPDINFPVVLVQTDFAGASPEVIESEITRRVEEIVNTISGINEISSR